MLYALGVMHTYRHEYTYCSYYFLFIFPTFIPDKRGHPPVECALYLPVYTFCAYPLPCAYVLYTPITSGPCLCVL